MTINTQNNAPVGTFTVEISRISNQSAFDWVLPTDWMQEILGQCEYEVHSDSGLCSLRMDAQPNRIHITGSVRFAVETECAVCLSKLKLDLCAHIDTFMQPADSAGDDPQDELTQDDLDIEFYTGNTLMLDDLLGDSILLELPMIPRCESACRKVDGLVTALELEEKEPTVDPRLSALADIKLSKES